MDQENVHVSYDQTLKPYHRVVARLAAKYATANSRILDIGCGVGHIADLLAHQRPAAQISIADAYQKCLDMTAMRVSVHERFLISEYEFDIERTSPPYDVIVMSHVLEHTRSPVDSLLKAQRLLTNDGYLVVAVPNSLSFHAIWASIRQRHYANRGHVAHWDRSHWVNFLERIVKADVLEYRSDYHLFPGSSRLRFLDWLGERSVRVLPWFSRSHIAVLR